MSSEENKNNEIKAEISLAASKEEMPVVGEVKREDKQIPPSFEEAVKEAESSGLKVKPFVQSMGYCGPAALKILLSYFGKDFSEEQLAQMASATRDIGAEHEGLVEAIKSIDGYVFVKENGTIAELEYFIKEEKLPIIVGWFERDGDHYSVVVNMTDKNLIMVDPATDQPERWVDKEVFPRIWFDFVGQDNKIVSWGWYMVVNFQKKKYKVKGGHYY